MPSSTDNGIMCGARLLCELGSRWPPVGEMAWPAGTIRGPSTQPKSMAFLRATSRSRPPVCTNSPRLRTVVKPDRKVRRALATPRNVFTAGSSCTATRGLSWFGPPMRRLTSMSMRPGRSVRSPRSITSASDGTDDGATSTMRSPSIRRSPGSMSSPLSTSSMRALIRWIGRSGVRGRGMSGNVQRMLQERREDHVCWLTFDRPERLNSFTVTDYRALRTALERCRLDDTTRVVVLTGNGRAFSAGADRSLLDGSAPDRDQATEQFTALLELLAAFEKPLLAAVNGFAVGVGCTMLLYADLVLVAESARLRFPFTALGLVPEAGSSVLLPARARSQDATWAMLSSEWIDAPHARDMGLAWRVAPDHALLEQTASAAATIAALDPASVVATKRLLTAGRADAARLAVARELDEMRSLGLSTDPGGS